MFGKTFANRSMIFHKILVRAFLLVGFYAALSAITAHAASKIVGDMDGFGFGTPVGGDVPINAYDNRTLGDPTFTDHTIPDTGGNVNFSFSIDVGTTFTSIGEAFFTMNLQEVEYLSNGLGERVFLDGIELESPLSNYTINGIPQMSSTSIRFFDTVVTQGNFSTDVVRLKLPVGLFPSLLDGAVTVTINGGGESFAIDYAQLEVYPVPEPSNWKGPGGGNYNMESNWSNNVVPNGLNSTANFSGSITEPSTITLDSFVTLEALNFDSLQSYTLAGTGSVTMQDSSGNASINVLVGNHEIRVPLVISSNTVINGPGTLVLSGGIKGNYTLTVFGNLTTTSIQIDTLTIGSTKATAVPEPSSILLLFFGILAWAWQRSRKTGKYKGKYKGVGCLFCRPIDRAKY